MPCVLVIADIASISPFPKAYFPGLSHLPLIQLIELEETCVDFGHQGIQYQNAWQCHTYLS